MLRLQVANSIIRHGFVRSKSTRIGGLQNSESFQIHKFGTLAQSQKQDINVCKKNEATTTNLDKINMNFSLEVAKRALHTTSINKNMICSPFSISTMLNALVAGSEGETLEQLLGLLDYQNLEEANVIASRLVSVTRLNDVGDGPTIAYANGVWLDKKYTLNASYKELLQNLYNTQLKVVDFHAKPDNVVKDVNSWCKEQTKGLIRNVLPSNHRFEHKMAMLLANALYFEGTWAETFNSSLTGKHTFDLLNGETVKVPFMEKSNSKYEYGSYENCKVLKMPYLKGKIDNRRFSMYIFLPNDKFGLPKLMESIKFHKNMFDKDHINLKRVDLDRILIPKFEFENTINPTNMMKQLGLTLPFEDPGLTGMVYSKEDGKWLYISDIVQNCYIKTNEKGTKASCVTIAGGYGCGYVRNPVVFVADHPFMFMIREDFSGVILFMGTVLNPFKD